MHILICCYTTAVFFFFTGLLSFYLGGWGGRWGGRLSFVLSVKLPPQGRWGIFLLRRHHDGVKGNSGVSAQTAGDLYRNKTSFNHRSSLIRITPVNPTPARNLVCVLRHTQKTDVSQIWCPRGIERERKREKNLLNARACDLVFVTQFHARFETTASDLAKRKQMFPQRKYILLAWWKKNENHLVFLSAGDWWNTLNVDWRENQPWLSSFAVCDNTTNPVLTLLFT